MLWGEAQRRPLENVVTARAEQVADQIRHRVTAVHLGDHEGASGTGRLDPRSSGRVAGAVRVGMERAAGLAA